MAIILQEIKDNADQGEEIIILNDNQTSHDLTSFDPIAALLLTITIFVVAILARPLLFLLTYVIQFGIIFGAIFLAVKFLLF